MPKHIILQSTHKKRTPNLTGLVRISPEAEETLISLKADTGLSMSAIASQMIIQGSEFVKIITPEDSEWKI